MATNSEYKSKLGMEIVIPLLLILGCTFYLHIAGGAWLGIVINSLVLLFVVYLYLQTKYIITGTDLVIRSGFFVNITIPIRDISSIRKTNNPISAPAFSLRRIEIHYGRSSSVIISPKDRAIFVTELQKINANIRYPV
jgi:hypothetical protein